MREQRIGRGAFLASFAAFSATGALREVARAQGPGFAPASLRLEAAARGRRVLAQFIGLSYESALVPGGAYFNGRNRSLINYVKGLGRGMLHVGGQSAERTAYNADDLNRLAEFANAVNWPVLIGMGLTHSSTDRLAQDAYLVTQALGEKLFAFEIGGAPDLRVARYEAYLELFRGDVRIINTNVPNSRFAGPSAIDHADWADRLAHDARTDLVMLTQQYEHTGSDEARLQAMLQTLGTAAENSSLPFRIVGIRSTGGPTLNAALWALDLCFRFAQAGADGVNFHDAGDAAVHPLYRALQLFTESTDARMVPTTIQTANRNLSAYAVERDDGTRIVTIVNRDSDAGATISLDAGRPPRHARVRRLTAFGLGAQEVSMPPWSAFDGSSLDVPPASAAVLEL